MAEYRVVNVGTSNIELHTTDVSFDVERSDDGTTWRKIEAATVPVKLRCTADEIVQQIHSRADAIALKDATLTDVFDEVRVILSAKKLEPIKPVEEKLEL